jgi:DNA-binding NtrC family response regulator
MVVAIRSVLWIGSAKGLADSALPQAPNVDVVWERDAAAARALPLAQFDAIVIEARDRDRAQTERARLGAAASRAAIVGCHPGEIAPERVIEEAGPTPFVAHSAGMRRVLELTTRAAASRATVLVTGETGTGKERVARAIHDRSERRQRAFVAVNCAALPDTLLESELLGHVRGAFSGAERDRKGLIEEADRGTLFLDEIAETSAAFQAKLLRVLQEHTLRPVGSNRERPVDLRVVAATHRDLRARVGEGRFREDLYYRIAVFPIPIPPLRERREDLAPLVDTLLARHREPAIPGPDLGEGVLPLLASHRWPGNVRELENELQRALALAGPGQALEPAHFSEALRNGGEADAGHPGVAPLPDEPLRETVARLEARLIRQALAANGGRRAQTARQLGLTREGLYKKMQVSRMSLGSWQAPSTGERRRPSRGAAVAPAIARASLRALARRSRSQAPPQPQQGRQHQHQLEPDATCDELDDLHLAAHVGLVVRVVDGADVPADEGADSARVLDRDRVVGDDHDARVALVDPPSLLREREALEPLDHGREVVVAEVGRGRGEGDCLLRGIVLIEPIRGIDGRRRVAEDLRRRRVYDLYRRRVLVGLGEEVEDAQHPGVALADAMAATPRDDGVWAREVAPVPARWDGARKNPVRSSSTRPSTGVPQPAQTR